MNRVVQRRRGGSARLPAVPLVRPRRIGLQRIALRGKRLGDLLRGLPLDQIDELGRYLDDGESQRVSNQASSSQQMTFWTA